MFKEQKSYFEKCTCVNRKWAYIEGFKKKLWHNSELNLFLLGEIVSYPVFYFLDVPYTSNYRWDRGTVFTWNIKISEWLPFRPNA